LIDSLVAQIGEPEIAGTEALSATSYFAYAGYSRLFQFFESRELLELERRYSHFTQLDIAACFDSIYSHSISWAVKSKKLAKRDRGTSHSCDARFDKIMQSLNHGETMGIPIGPEVSRIFAEVLLQSVDVYVEEQCEKQAQSVPDVDFTVRRYVDDYFVFYNSQDVCDRVCNIISQGLGRLKLRLNDAKNRMHQRPFTTPLSKAKQEIVEEFSTATASVIAASQAGQGETFRKRPVVDTVRAIIASSGVLYEECVPLVFGMLRETLARTKAECEVTAQAVLNDLLARESIAAAFFFLNVSTTYHTGVAFARFIYELRDVAERCGETSKKRVERAVCDEFHALLYTVARSRNIPAFELSNVLLALSDIESIHPLPKDPVRRIWFGPEELEKCDYFMVCCLIYSLAGREEFAEEIAALTVRAVRRVTEREGDFTEADTFCLTLDLLACPHVSGADKESIGRRLRAWTESRPAEKLTRPEITEFVTEMSGASWFFDWSTERETGFYLKKKEVSSAY